MAPPRKSNTGTPFSRWLDHTLRTRRDPASGRYITQQDVAEACGLTQSSVSHILSGRRRPAADVVIQLANFLEEDVNTLLQLAGYAPITGDVVLSAGSDPLAVRLLKAVRPLLTDKKRMAIAVAMLEAMLHEGEGHNADTTVAGDRKAK
jgi:transcriptional regulator with XRE-family HTH domain